MSGVLPEALFDGQEFVDAYRIKWVYKQNTDLWIRVGKVEVLPVADGTNVGLLPSALKFLLDTIPEKAGGFAIVTKPLLAKRVPANPDGVLFGDIELVSDSLDIQCVDSDGNKIGDACKKVAFKEYDDLPPGFDINLSDLLLETLCVEVPGGPGPIGPDGEQGNDGADGTGDGPSGLQGESGRDATTRHKLTGVKIIDVDDIFDTAVVKLELDAPAGKLFVTKGKVATPDGVNTAATQLVVNQISRGINFTDCWDYKMVKIPCRFEDDFDVVDPLIASYPANFNPDTVDGQTAYPLVRARLSGLVNEIISFYRDKLDKQAAIYDKQIADFMKSKDSESRKVLDELGDRLAQCENITYLEYCIGIEGECNMPPPPPPTTTEGDTLSPDQSNSNDKDCSSLIDFLVCTDKKSSTCRTIADSVVVTGAQSPVLAIASPGPMGADSQLPPIGGYHTPAQMEASYKPFLAALKQAITDSYIVYYKTQVRYSNTTVQFPAGTYCFIYQGGAFRQERRSDAEQQGNGDTNIINGPFQDYYVGNEGGGSGNNPFCLISASDPSGCIVLNGPFYSTSIGLEVGFAPSDYVDPIPGNYFDQHKFDPNYEVGNASFELPNPRVDHVGLTAAQKAMENKIAWSSFPAISGPHSDSGDLENAYKNAALDTKMLVISLPTPGFVYVRCKPATSWVDASGMFPMPPVTLAGSLNNGFPSRNVTFNRLVLRRQADYFQPYVNARPYAAGEVTLKVVQVDCKDLPLASEGASVAENG